MDQEQILKMIAGMGKIAKESANHMTDSAASFLDSTIMKGKYVTREEYEVLHQLTLALKNQVDKLEEMLNSKK